MKNVDLERASLKYLQQVLSRIHLLAQHQFVDSGSKSNGFATDFTMQHYHTQSVKYTNRNLRESGIEFQLQSTELAKELNYRL